MSSYISHCHLEGSEFLCPPPNNLFQITFGHKCCREHRLTLRDRHLHQHQDIQQPWELLGLSPLGTPSTQIWQGDILWASGVKTKPRSFLGMETGSPGLSSVPWPESKLSQTQRQCHPASFGHCLRTATLLSRDFCGK